MSLATDAVKMLMESKNMVIQIETVHNSVFRGKCQSVDGNLNITLEDAVQQGSERRIGKFFIRGSAIKFVVMPEAAESCFQAGKLVGKPQ